MIPGSNPGRGILFRITCLSYIGVIVEGGCFLSDGGNGIGTGGGIPNSLINIIASSMVY